MKHNILTVANENYSSFIKLFINSLFELTDLKMVEKIYVFDTGLSEETKKHLNYFPKIEIMDTGMQISSDKIHDDGWKKNTYSKTKFLLSILQKTNLPTFMIDSDSIFVDNFQDLIDWNADLVACDRNRDGFSKHIGSFFGAINVDQSITFIEKWITNISKLQRTTDLKHCESPALSLTIESENFNVQNLPEQIVSAVFPDETSRVFHLKSDYYALTVEERLSLKHAKQFTQRYL
tara:strand:- start:391 stop:1095 length:705 start_codon:yes stop_codon:yes gene_type:complete